MKQKHSPCPKKSVHCKKERERDENKMWGEGSTWKWGILASKIGSSLTIAKYLYASQQRVFSGGS